MTNTTAKFLTLFAIPVLFGCTDDYPDCYNEVTFIKSSSSDFVLNKQYYSNGNAGLLEQETISGDEGVYRVPITPDCAYDRVDISLNLDVDFELENLFSEAVFEGDPDPGLNWSEDGITHTPTRSVNAFQNTDKIGFEVMLLPGITYSITQLITRTGGGTGFENISIEFYESVGDQFEGSSGSHSYSYTASESFQITPTRLTRYIVFRIDRDGDGSGTGSYTYTIGATSISSDDAVSETKQYKIDCGCSAQELRLTWINNLGGFDYWKFTARKDHIIEIRETIETKKNILPQWPKSYSTNADTIRRQTARVSNKAYTVRSQYITQSEADALAYIKSSVLVQIINSRTDRRTVIVDADSFVIYPDGADLYSIAFNVSFTDDIPSQTV